MSKFADWLQIIGNFAIVGGLIMVGVQVNQNTQVAQADLTTRAFELLTQYHLTTMGENPAAALAKAATDPGDLTDEELMVLRADADFWWNFDQRAQRQVELGYRSDEDLELLQAVWRARARTVWSSNLVHAAYWKKRSAMPGVAMGWVDVVDEEFQTLEAYNWDAQILSDLRGPAASIE